MCTNYYADCLGLRHSLGERRRVVVLALFGIADSIAAFLAATGFSFDRIFRLVDLFFCCVFRSLRQ